MESLQAPSQIWFFLEQSFIHSDSHTKSNQYLQRPYGSRSAAYHCRSCKFCKIGVQLLCSTLKVAIFWLVSRHCIGIAMSVWSQSIHDIEMPRIDSRIYKCLRTLSRDSRVSSRVVKIVGTDTWSSAGIACFAAIKALISDIFWPSRVSIFSSAKTIFQIEHQCIWWVFYVKDIALLATKGFQVSHCIWKLIANSLVFYYDGRLICW